MPFNIDGMITTIPLSEFTEAKISGEGAFDVLMRANKAHLAQEYDKNRIKGAEYATVYLGSLESTMRAALDFLIQGKKTALEALLLEQQIILAKVGVEKALAELEIAKLMVLKVPAEIALLEAQTEMVNRQADNELIQGTVLQATKCKLDAEFDVLLMQKLKVAAESELLGQKVQTEKAQVMTMGVDSDSVIGRQKLLYQAQTEGFQRDAEQKASKIMVDSWNTRRMTDEGTVADGTNMLNDVTVGRAVSKLLSGVGA